MSGVRGAAASALFVQTPGSGSRRRGRPQGEALTASVLTRALQVTVGRVGAYQGRLRLSPSSPRPMGLPGGCGPHLKPAPVAAEYTLGAKCSLQLTLQNKVGKEMRSRVYGLGPIVLVSY